MASGEAAFGLMVVIAAPGQAALGPPEFPNDGA